YSRTALYEPPRRHRRPSLVNHVAGTRRDRYQRLSPLRSPRSSDFRTPPSTSSHLALERRTTVSSDSCPFLDVLLTCTSAIVHTADPFSKTLIIMSFEEAVDKVKNLNQTPSDSNLLELYAYYKQVTVGDVNTAKPGFLDFKAKAKWEAWNSKKGISSDEAKTKYIEIVDKLVEDIGLKA
ncbi:enoyl-CoA delta isomerase 2, partial [Aphis gossypii]|uniref:enoyl-CoA delta isomerase 2 n=1 Tax=Aphis gossypii TaxID=80765 RepID=UPI002158F5E7